MSFINAKLEYFKVSGGVDLYFQRWMPESPKAILIFVHGLSEHVGRYNAFRRFFNSKDYGVCLYDMRGHGKSGGRKTHVNKFYEYLYDLAEFIEFVRKTSPNAPIFLVGHSLGGQIILNFVVKYAKAIRGAVVLSPNIRISLTLPKWKTRIGEIGAKWFPTIRIKNNIDPATLTHDANIVEKYKNDENIRKDITLRCGYEIVKNTELVMALASRIHVPIMLLHGGSDTLCDPDATRKFFMRVSVPSKRLKIYPGLYHELLNEVERDQVLMDMETWVEQQLDVEYRLAGSGGRKGE